MKILVRGMTIADDTGTRHTPLNEWCRTTLKAFWLAWKARRKNKNIEMVIINWVEDGIR